MVESVHSNRSAALQLLKDAFHPLDDDKDGGILGKLCDELFSNVPAVELLILYIQKKQTKDPSFEVEESLKEIQKVKQELSNDRFSLEKAENVITARMKLLIRTLEEIGAESKNAVDVLRILSRFKPDHPISISFLEALLTTKMLKEDKNLIRTFNFVHKFYETEGFEHKPKSAKVRYWFWWEELGCNYMLPNDCSQYGNMLNTESKKTDLYLQRMRMLSICRNRLHALGMHFDQEIGECLKTSINLLVSFGLIEFQGENKYISIPKWINPENISQSSCVDDNDKHEINLLGSLRRLCMQKKLTLEDTPHALSIWEYEFKSTSGDNQLIAFDGIFNLLNRLVEFKLFDQRSKLVQTAYDALLPMLGDANQDRVICLLKTLKEDVSQSRIILQFARTVDRGTKDAELWKKCYEWEVKKWGPNHKEVLESKLFLVKELADRALELVSRTEVGEIDREIPIVKLMVNAFTPVHDILEKDLRAKRFAICAVGYACTLSIQPHASSMDEPGRRGMSR